MTKEEAIKYLERCESNIGVFVVVIGEEDIEKSSERFTECIIENNIVDNYNKLNEEEKKHYLSDMADKMEVLYQEEHFADDIDKVYVQTKEV